jgi:hypothetical protein
VCCLRRVVQCRLLVSKSLSRPFLSFPRIYSIQVLIFYYATTLTFWSITDSDTESNHEQKWPRGKLIPVSLYNSCSEPAGPFMPPKADIVLVILGLESWSTRTVALSSRVHTPTPSTWPLSSLAISPPFSVPVSLHHRGSKRFPK